MIDKKNKGLSVRRQSELLKINRSTLFYEETDKTAIFTLSNRIGEIYSEFPIYGYRKIRSILQREGKETTDKVVRRLMREMKLYAIYPKPKTSIKDTESIVFPYLLRDLSITKAHQVWQIDITYLRTTSGFVYLVAIIDVHSRMIVGYRISNDLCTESCISALEDAILTHGSPEILNSDQGSQFTSESWINTAQHYNIKLSQTGKGRCIDNIYIERLWRSFKYEGSYLYQWDTVYSLKTNIGKWVRWYNYGRPHQSLNYSTPAEILFKAYSSNNSNISVAKFNIVQEVNM